MLYRVVQREVSCLCCSVCCFHAAVMNDGSLVAEDDSWSVMDKIVECATCARSWAAAPLRSVRLHSYTQCAENNVLIIFVDVCSIDMITSGASR